MMGHSSERLTLTIGDMSEHHRRVHEYAGRDPRGVATGGAEGHELPAAVRVALWATLVLGGRLRVEELPRRALPDIDECDGLKEAVELWAGLGERVVLAALPRPGDLTGLPHGTPEMVQAALTAEECVYVPGIGGVLVPTLGTFGPEGDQGWLARWTAYPADPVPTHRIEALDLGHVERTLRTELAEVTAQLVRAGGLPVGPSADHGLARARAARSGAGSWGIPDGLPPRALRVIDLAATVLALTEAGLDPALESVDATSTTRRSALLRRLRDLALTALADGTNAAALHLAFRS